MADAFDILGLEPSFDLSRERLGRAYLARSAMLHPDLVTTDDDSARRMALLNAARSTLEDPERRANALLSRLGGPSKEQDRTLPEGFLAEMMDVREQIEAAAGSPAARATWEAWVQERRREAIAEILSMFRALSPQPGANELRAIRVRLNAWRYVERLIEQLDPDYDPARADFQG